MISEELVESEEEREMDWDLGRELERDLGRELERDLDLERETGPGCGPMFSMLMTMSSGMSERLEIGDIGDNERLSFVPFALDLDLVVGVMVDGMGTGYVLRFVVVFKKKVEATLWVATLKTQRQKGQRYGDSEKREKKTG